MCCPITRTSAGPAHGHRVVLVVPKREREEWRLQGKAVLLGASLGASPPPGRRMRSPMIAEAQRIYRTFLSRAALVPFLLGDPAQPVALQRGERRRIEPGGGVEDNNARGGGVEHAVDDTLLSGQIAATTRKIIRGSCSEPFFASRAILA